MPKLLRDFLHEQQVPFSMELYLLERGYDYDKVSRFSQKKARNAASNYAYFFISVINRLTSAKDKKKKMESNSKHIHDQEKSRKQNAYGEEDDELSSSRSRKSLLSADDDHHYDVLSSKEESRKSTSMEDTIIAKQLSPVSVLEETESDEGDSPLHRRTEHFKTTTTAKGESSSASKSQRFSSSTDHQYITNKRILHESQKLLIDTVKEVIEIHKRMRGERDEKKQQGKRILMGADELWKLVCEYLWAWSKDVITDESNVVQLLHCDFLGSQEDWKNGYDMHKRMVCEQVGDGILQELILEVF